MPSFSCLGSKGVQGKRPKTLSQCTQATVHAKAPKSSTSFLYRLVEFSWKELLRLFSNALQTAAFTEAEALEICVVNHPFKCKSSLEVRGIFTGCSESGWACSAHPLSGKAKLPPATRWLHFHGPRSGEKDRHPVHPDAGRGGSIPPFSSHPPPPPPHLSAEC